ncbi:PhoU domain-containing protein [Natronospira bacteriovora]|uniref:PhoU domain-containing protein n=1 Tax=Natronospira bacteriovora TaxID=3069753 RepID=A0ABU0W5G1_9GAMM|nr:PhoU domain-containing protein [Natronospira sp. AB-CW4]MDQ2069226.1 PhoU domain-containing protein [Natronospira sp. AB-CW4]
MFRQIFSALASEKNSVDKAFADLSEMLDHGAWMFQRANEVLHSEVPAEEVHDAIYRRDRAINELERSIRRKVLRYLTVNPGYDVAVCLALMSVAKDAERIGDYCKNVFEVGQFYTRGFHVPRYHEPLDKVSADINEIFNMVSKACRASDEDLAQQAIELSRQARGICDGVIQDLFKEEEAVEMHEAVAYSLLARHYKRVIAHLSNIATALLGQLEDLDFFADDDEDD